MESLRPKYAMAQWIFNEIITPSRGVMAVTQLALKYQAHVCVYST
jgi:hypothetical protein